MKAEPKPTIQVVNGAVDAPSIMDVQSFPCPRCGVEGQPEKIVTPEVKKEITPGGDVIELPSHFVYMRCRNCRLQLWVGVDENFKLLEEIDLGDYEAN